ncbi:hypothetical protein L1987_02332 [Smallanthus sonchifolius]|uniref:Uncharacterized protein n=1 Tax=Smallanthus sonchifolius TaxID=185202 RepID=A0ACB9K7Q3_9ASTR|nr:hypothetical protein L1987_02332 [Smallanthus sonchifolius]
MQISATLSLRLGDDIKQQQLGMIFDLTTKKLISYDIEKSSENQRENFLAFIQGLISYPLDIPRTAYHKCLQEKNDRIKG